MSHGGLIDVHAHFTTEAYIAAAKEAGLLEPDGMPEAYWPRWSAEAHLELMRRHGIERSMLSISSPGVHFGDDSAAGELAQEVNDVAAGLVHAHPGQFGFFASLPAPDIDGSLRELPRALDTLGAAGVILLTNSHGHYLGDELFAPLLAELDRREAVVFLHPTSTEDHATTDLGRPRPMIEFLFDTARTVIDYVLSGDAQRYPGIRLIVPHTGGVLPVLAERVELFRQIAGESGTGPTVREQLRRFHFDLAGAPNATQLTALTEFVSADRLLYGSDYAWTRPDAVASALDGLDTLLKLANGPWREVVAANARALFPSADVE
jgi:predicted TIM-barrel fold metal-dependent hydrolase